MKVHIGASKQGLVHSLATGPANQADIINRARPRCRARGEHPFHVIKRLWGFAKVRYRGLAKNTVRAFAMFALANLHFVRRRLSPRGAQLAL